MKKSYNVDYKDLKFKISKACAKSSKGSIKFNVSLERLNDMIKDMGLTMINNGTISDLLEAKDIPLISEYFKYQDLSWFRESREYTSLVFVKNESIDETLQSYLDQLNEPISDQGTIDRMNIVANIIAQYPCYIAVVVSYQSNEPGKENRPSYEIKIRANAITIKNENYVYNNDDIVG